MFSQFSTKLYSAPMAGFTNDNFIYYLHIGGADYIYSEMFNVNEIIKNRDRLNFIFNKKDFKYIIQIFGKYGDNFSLTSELLSEYCDGIDINAGCSVKKIIKSGGGSFLLKEPEYLYRIIKSVKGSIEKPVSVKMRLGFDKIQIFELLDSIIESGVSFITIHLRTASMLFGGDVDYSYIQLIQDKYRNIINDQKVRFIFNGDIDSKEKAYFIINKYNPYGIMIGRASLSDPFIFWRIKLYLENVRSSNLFYYGNSNNSNLKNFNYKKIPIFWFNNIFLQNIAILIGLYKKIELLPENERKNNILLYRKIAHKLLKNIPESKEIKEYLNKETDINNIIQYLILKRNIIKEKISKRNNQN
ncbi:MAG: tRNA-dihydrouridine synthase family protein [Spirochaetes bacterium]|nr:tRNA-dihydrouridine synthase family protein [Spirochaetota bacterium]